MRKYGIGIREYVEPIALAAVMAGADGIILRVWVGKPGEIARVPATLAWNDAVDLAERVRATAAAVRG